MLRANGFAVFAIFAVLALVAPRKRGTWGCPRRGSFPAMGPSSVGVPVEVAPDTNGAGLAKVVSTANSLGNFLLGGTVLMTRFRNFLPLVAVLVGAAILGAPTQARADFDLEYSTDGGVTFTALPVTVGPGGTQSVILFGNVSLNVTATGSGLTSSALTTLDLSITGTDSTLGGPGVTRSVVVKASIDGLLTAPPPQILQYVESGSIFGGVSGVSISQNTLVSSAGNTLFATTPVLVQETTTVPNGGPTTTTNTQFSGTVPYSATTSFTFGYTVAANSFASVSLTDNNSITPTPVPAGFVLLASGAPAFGLYWLRRRKAKVQNS